MRLEVLDLDDATWANHVREAPDASAFHTPEWASVIVDTYGFRAFGAALRDDSGRIVAAVPLAEVRTILRKRKWVALPFTDVCPILGPSATEKRQLVEAVQRRASTEGISVLEVRDDVESSLIRRPVAVQHVLRLAPDPETLRGDFHSSQIRRPLRKALEAGTISIREGVQRSDLTEVFYKLHTQTRARLGVPVQPLRFFELLWERMIETGLGRVLIASAEGRDIAAAVFLTSGDTFIYKYGASDEHARRLRANLVLFWQAIRDACTGGWQSFDFGRSDFDNEGLRAFKTNWGAEERPLVYATTTPAAPEATARSAGSRIMTSIIRRAPDGFARSVGRVLYKYAA